MHRCKLVSGARGLFPDRMRPRLAYLVLLLFCLGRLAAQTPEIVIAFKAVGFQQTSATARDVYQPGYGIEVLFPAAVSLNTSVQLIGPGVNIAIPREDVDAYFVERYFADEAVLNQNL